MNYKSKNLEETNDPVHQEEPKIIFEKVEEIDPEFKIKTTQSVDLIEI